MIAINCIKCRKEFKISGTDFEERKKNKIPDICPACMGEKGNIEIQKQVVIPKSVKRKVKIEEIAIDEIVKK